MRVCLIHLLITFVLTQRAFSQDNIPPVFSSPQYVFSVSEDATVGTPLTNTSPITGVSVYKVTLRYQFCHLVLSESISTNILEYESIDTFIHLLYRLLIGQCTVQRPVSRFSRSDYALHHRGQCWGSGEAQMESGGTIYFKTAKEELNQYILIFIICVLER